MIKELHLQRQIGAVIKLHHYSWKKMQVDIGRYGLNECLVCRVVSIIHVKTFCVSCSWLFLDSNLRVFL